MRYILVVDDNQDGADTLAILLRLKGVEVAIAYDGHAALESIEARPPDVVLLDIGMPGLDGYEVAGRIRSNPAFADVRIVAVTGWGAQLDRERSRAAGFDEHWVKPIDPDLLDSLTN